MKKLVVLLIAVFITAGISNKLMAQASANADADAYATIVTPISIAQVADLHFGNVAIHATNAGTVELSPLGVRTPTGGVTLPNVTGTVNAASFTVTGQADYTYAITLPGGDHIIENPANDQMIVKTFTSDPDGTGLLTAGTQTLNVGATLQVTGGQPTGTYTSVAPFTVTVNYN